MRLPRPKDVGSFWTGVTLVALGLYGLSRHHADVQIVYAFLAIGVLRIVLSLVVVWPSLGGGKPGPGTLSPTPAGRFRATGWPPSKDPDDYR